MSPDPVAPTTPAPHPDLAQVKDYWRSSADAWLGHADTMARMADRFNQPLLAAADIQPAQTVLDLASGAGEPALTAARLVGPSGTVIASDLVSDMLHGLTRRDGAGALKFTAADMQRLPFQSACFDRVLCRFGIMFVPDPLAALSSVRRVLRPGGRAAFMVWGPRGDQTMFPLLADAIEAVLGIEPDSHHHQIFRFGATGSLTEIFEQAGFTDIEESEHRYSPLAPGNMPFWRPQLKMSFAGHIAGHNDDTLRALDQEIQQRLESCREGEGYRLAAHIRIVSGTAPG